MLFSLLFLAIGAALLYESASEPKTTQTAALLVGAAFFALGLVATWVSVTEWLKWRREGKEFRGE
jgi:hypothetical protein